MQYSLAKENQTHPVQILDPKRNQHRAQPFPSRSLSFFFLTDPVAASLLKEWSAFVERVQALWDGVDIPTAESNLRGILSTTVLYPQSLADHQVGNKFHCFRSKRRLGRGDHPPRARKHYHLLNNHWAAMTVVGVDISKDCDLNVYANRNLGRRCSVWCSLASRSGTMSGPLKTTKMNKLEKGSVEFKLVTTPNWVSSALPRFWTTWRAV